MDWTDVGEYGTQWKTIPTTKRSLLIQAQNTNYKVIGNIKLTSTHCSNYFLYIQMTTLFTIEALKRNFH